MRVGWAILTTGGRWVVTGLVMLGVLLTPVHCTLVDHPHSLFDTLDALAGSAHAGSAHAGHGGLDAVSSGGAHLDLMAYGAPPLAAGVAPALPDLLVSPVPRGLMATSTATLAGATTAVVPAAGAIPTVSSAAMTMVATGMTALHVALALLLIVVTVAARRGVAVPALTGRMVTTLSPPPRPAGAISV